MSTLFVCNAFIIHRLSRMKRFRQRQASQTTATPGGAKAVRTGSLTIMFLAVSITFLCLITPSISIFISETYWPTDAHSQAKLKLAFVATDILSQLNHCINFFLYILTGRRFRQELFLMLGVRSNRIDPAEASTISGSNK